MTDDLILIPRVKTRERQSVRERSQRDRQIERTVSRRRRGGRGVAALAARRRMAGARTARAARGAGRAAGMLKFIGRAFGLLTFAVQGTIWQGRVARQKQGQSRRLIDATDAHTIFGLMDEQIAANVAARDWVESDPMKLYVIGQQGRVNSQILQMASDMRTQAWRRITGRDIIDRDPSFDVPDSEIDQLTYGGFGAIDAWEGIRDRLDRLIKIGQMLRGGSGK